MCGASRTIKGRNTVRPAKQGFTVSAGGIGPEVTTKRIILRYISTIAYQLSMAH